MFQFNFKKYDFWIIYESIRQYNPIGIEKDRYGFFDSFPGHKKLGEIINDNIHDEENFQTRWKNFEKQLKSKIKYPIEGTTYGQAPSFSSYVEIEKISKKE